MSSTRDLIPPLTPGSIRAFAEGNLTGYTFTTTTHKDIYPSIDPTTIHLSPEFVVFITGASRGCGKAIALAYAKAGASGIVISSRTASELEETACEIEELFKQKVTDLDGITSRVLKIICDVSDKESVKAAVEETRVKFGRLDVLVNNAGQFHGYGRIGEERTEDDFLNIIGTNLNGLYMMTRYFIPLMLSTNNGQKQIINISSAMGLTIWPGYCAYQTSKFALFRFSELLDVEYGSEGIITISLHPGNIRTKTALKLPHELAEEILVDSPNLTGGTLVWLTKERRPWLSGRYVMANWDVDQLEGKKKDILDSDLLKMRMCF